jgi:hypothetical protein
MAEVLADRAIAAATSEPRHGDEPEPDATLGRDAAYAQALGAVVALRRVGSLSLSEAIGRGVIERLTPLAESAAGREISRVLATG